MKRKFSKIWGIGLTVVMLASLMVFAAPVAADPGELYWEAETIPTISGKVLTPSSDVTDIAVAADGVTIYAVDTEADLLFKSANAGASWTELSNPSGCTEPQLVAVSPDDADFVAIVADDKEVYLSKNGGASWTDLGTVADSTASTTAKFIYSIDIAPEKAGVKNIAVGGVSNAGAAGLWYFNQGGTRTAWTDATAWTGFEPSNEVRAAKFSPNFSAIDDTLVAVTVGPAIIETWGGTAEWSTTPTAYGGDYCLELTEPVAAKVACGITLQDLVNLGYPTVGVPVFNVAFHYWFDTSDPPHAKFYLATNDDDVVDAVLTAGFMASTSTEDTTATQSKWIEAWLPVGTNWDLADYDEGVFTSAGSGSLDELVAEGKLALTAKIIYVAYGCDSVVYVDDITIGTVVYPLEPQVDFQIACFATGVTRWNHSDDYGAGYPKDITQGLTDLDSASITLDANYDGSDSDTMIAFVGLADADGDEGGIERLWNVTLKELKADVEIHSVAYNTDADKLVAGAYDSNYVYRADAPTATTVTVRGATKYKRPGIDTSGVNEKVVVAWAGDNVVAGTSGNESAFAISESDGKTFNDISLIDTVLNDLDDVAVSADGSKVYLLSRQTSGSDISLWRKASSWARVLTLAGGGSGYIVRLAPEDADVVYLAKVGTKNVYTTTDVDASWRYWAGRCTVDIADLAVESADTAYALSSTGSVSKTTTSGSRWSSVPKATGISTGNMIASLGVDELIIGGTDYVGYSDDGNSSWTVIAKPLAGDLQVTADGVADGNHIYAASEDAGYYVKRWKIGTSTVWSTISSAFTGYSVYGLGLRDGALYVLASGATSITYSKVYRALYPTASTVTTCRWGTTTTGADVTFVSVPHALRLTSGSTKIWAIDTADDALYSFIDTLVAAGPALTSPADGEVVSTTPTLRWEKFSAPGTITIYYSWEVSSKEDFTEVVQESGETPITARFKKLTILTAGTKYWWRVWVAEQGTNGDTLQSPRTVRSLTAKLAIAVLCSPECGETKVPIKSTFTWYEVTGATSYDFELADNPEFSGATKETLTTVVYVPETDLEYATTYYWRVRATGATAWTTCAFTTVAAPVTPVVPSEVPSPFLPYAKMIPMFAWIIISVGAVLAIAVVILIVRTRRAP